MKNKLDPITQFEHEARDAARNFFKKSSAWEDFLCAAIEEVMEDTCTNPFDDNGELHAEIIEAQITEILKEKIS